MSIISSVCFLPLTSEDWTGTFSYEDGDESNPESKFKDKYAWLSNAKLSSSWIAAMGLLLWSENKFQDIGS